MNKVKQVLAILLIVLVVITGAYFFGMAKGKAQVAPKITSSTIEEQLQSVKELTTVKYHYTNMGSFENQNEFYGFKIPFTQKKFIISYDGVINAGVVLDNSEITINGSVINIKLAPAQILSHEIFEDSIQIFDEKNSIFNPIKLQDYATFSIDQKQTMESKAIEKGLLVDALENTKTAITEMLNINPEIAENFRIRFE